MKTKEDLLYRIKKIHQDCFRLCKATLGEYLSVSGNIGIFCQSEQEHQDFTEIRKKLTELSDNPNQKYFLLKEPITIPAEGDIPQTTYTHLYIRKPDPSPYGKYLGDVDFVMETREYEELKENVKQGRIKGTKIYDRPGWDTVQITDPSISSVAYISTQEFAEKVRVKFD